MTVRRVLLVGPPGAGKGTQAVRLAERLAVPHVASGNLLREEIANGSELGRAAKDRMDRGDLVPDQLIIGMMSERLTEPDCEGFVLDGFPRTAVQAEALDAKLAELGRPLHIVVLMKVDEDELFRRITGRRTCPACQSSYHMISNPPSSDEVCDRDGERLVTRADDTPEAFGRRLRIYRAEAAELKEYYDRSGLLVRVDGLGSVEEVSDRLDRAVEAGP